METGVIYKWKCLTSGKEYIGQTNKEDRRKKQFLDFGNKYAGNVINNARKKYSDEHQWQYSIVETVICESVEQLKDRLDELEKYYIKEYNTTAPNGYNITDGGGGIVVNGSIGYWNGRSRSESTKRKIGNANRGTKHSRESIEAAVKKRKENPNYRAIFKGNLDGLKKAHEICKIKVYQYDKEGELVATHNSIVEAAKAMMCSESVISDCIKGKYCGNRIDFNGYVWSSKELDKEYVKVYEFGNSWKKGEIYIYDDNLKLLGVFDTKVEAASYLGVGKTYITGLLSTGDNYAVYKRRFIISYNEINKNDVDKICQYTIDGNLLKTYYDVRFVPDEYDRECIRKCISGEYGKKSNIYKWCKWTDGNNEQVRYNIVKKNKDGEIVEKFRGVKDIITKYPEYNSSSIYNCLRMKNGKKKNFYKNFYWESVIK